MGLGVAGDTPESEAVAPGSPPARSPIPPRMMPKAAVANATDDRSFLVGGWIHHGRPVCLLSLTRLGHWHCPGIALYASKTAPDAIEKIPNDPWFGVYIVDVDKYFADLAKTGDVAPFESTRPVVVRIHTHDSTCTAEVPGCASLPVLVDVVWVGPAS
jgi:hypothetical protein